MRKETLIELMRTNDVICYDENGVACKLTKEDKDTIAESIEKTIKEKPIWKVWEHAKIIDENTYRYLTCASCGGYVGDEYTDEDEGMFVCCPTCGQAIDWSCVE